MIGMLHGQVEFQSTLSMRRATNLADAAQLEQLISIHALHEESDMTVFELFPRIAFQSTLSMRRATSLAVSHIGMAMRFQSTLSMRRATVQLDIFVRFLRRKPAA